MDKLMRKIDRNHVGSANVRVDPQIEVVVMPVSDMDRAKEFYVRLGWRLEQNPSGTVQLTVPGSGCSLQLGANLTTAVPGSGKGYVIVSDIEATRSEIIAAGIQVGEIFHIGPKGPVLGPDPKRRTYRSLALFSDPDGNSWVLQEITSECHGPKGGGSAAFGSEKGLTSHLLHGAAIDGRDERRIGQARETWPDWYSDFMVHKQARTTIQGRPM